MLSIRNQTTVVIAITVVFCFSYLALSQNQPQSGQVSSETVSEQTEYAAVWFSYSDWQNRLSDKREAEFTEEVRQILSSCRQRGLNTVILQLRAFGDAFYPSDCYPFSAYLGQTPDYDPLAIWLEQAKQAGILIEGWINPFRLGTRISESDTALWRLYRHHPLAMSKDDDGRYWLDPANPQAVELILSGIDELLEQYRLVGLWMDDYFYSGVTPQQFGYGDETAREALTSFVTAVSNRCEIPFGISPMGNFTADGEPKSDRLLYTSLQSWCESGLLDRLMPQVYYGFLHETAPFLQTTAQWERMLADCSTTLYFSLAAYKCKQSDCYAGSGQDEWRNDPTVLSRQVQHLTEQGYGYGLFRYHSLDAAQEETGYRQAVSRNGCSIF